MAGLASREIRLTLTHGTGSERKRMSLSSFLYYHSVITSDVVIQPVRADFRQILMVVDVVVDITLNDQSNASFWSFKRRCHHHRFFGFSARVSPDAGSG